MRDDRRKYNNLTAAVGCLVDQDDGTQVFEFKGKSYDQRPKMVKKGIEIDIREFTKTAGEDCEIYKCLEKYGMIKPEILDANCFAGDIEAYKDLRTNLERANHAQRMWDNLPLKVRADFNNDINVFLDEGEAYAQKLLQKAAEKVAPLNAAASDGASTAAPDVSTVSAK